jgi:hypothetical protein
VAQGRDVDPGFEKRLAAINASVQQAKADLDRHEPKFDRQWFLPRADWRETGQEQLQMAEPSEPRCGSEAIVEMEAAVPYGIPVVTRHSVFCKRPVGHDGIHATSVRRHQFRKSLWQAYGWSDRINPTPTVT